MTMIYEKKCEILMRDCDMFKRAKPSAILAMFQDCSESLTEGWGIGLDHMLERGLVWVLAKVSCKAERLPVHGESVTVRGWAGRSRTGICPFHYVIEDAEGNQIITGCAMWVLSDLASHSMMSPNVPRISMPTPEPERAPLPRMAPIVPPAEYRQTSRGVLFSEVDINGHLTNTRYIDWVCDLAEPEFHRNHAMKGLRIDYRAETFPAEEIVLDWAVSDERLWCRSQGRFEAMILF